MEKTMDRTTKYLARLVSTGAASTKGLNDFKAAMLILGWEGRRGLGVVNHTSGERVKSWAALADTLLETPAAKAVSIPLDGPAEAEAPEDTEPTVAVVYTTHTAQIPVTDQTTASAVIQDVVETAAGEGPCESGAALDCTGSGFLRILPESMLPGSGRERAVQCLPCYEASADAYTRKLHHYAGPEA